jgi:hypothetical protein
VKKNNTIEIASPLMEIIEKSNLGKTKAEYLLENFSGYFKLAGEWEVKARAIKITSPDQKGEMKMAREGRLFLREKRIQIEKARKELKADALREGQTIDAIAKILTNLIVPIEEHLDRQEHFIEIEAEKAKLERFQERLKILATYDYDEDPIINVKEATDEHFSKYVETLEAKKQAKIAEQERIEQERIDTENKRQAELKKAQDDAKKQQELRELLAKRAQKLTEVGFAYNGLSFIYEEIAITGILVANMIEEEFSKFLTENSSIIEKREEVKAEARKKAEAKAQKERDDLNRKYREEKARKELELRNQREEFEKKRKAQEAETLKAQEQTRKLTEAIKEFKVSVNEAGEYTFEFDGFSGSGATLKEAVYQFSIQYENKL